MACWQSSTFIFPNIIFLVIIKVIQQEATTVSQHSNHTATRWLILGGNKTPENSSKNTPKSIPSSRVITQ
jgi:hypothetical protein